ncbi:hypothetical protein [Roseibium sp.]|uniref:hypothetical protein n=1 Tax=Roseibium sp. TaxID=1936156 RepID=UPI003BAF6632
MSDSTPDQPKQPLGVGSLIAESFSILFRYFVPIVLIAFIPNLLGVLLSGYLVGFEVAIGLEEVAADGSGAPGLELLTSLVDMVVYSITTAFLVQLAYDAKLGRPIRIARYIGPALGAIVPIVILGFAVSVMVGLAAIALLIPGLWVYAVFSVMEPAVVIERLGYSGLGRSAELTKEYRWPILGALVPIFICMALIFVLAFFIVQTLGYQGNLIVSVLLFSTIAAVGTSLLSVFVSLLYARLREIKEGVGVDEIASVFD